MGNFEKRKAKVSSPKRVGGVRDKTINQARIERFSIKIDKENPTGRKKGNGMDNEIENIESNCPVAGFNFFFKKKILSVFVIFFVENGFKVLEAGGKTKTNKVKW